MLNEKKSHSWLGVVLALALVVGCMTVTSLAADVSADAADEGDVQWTEWSDAVDVGDEVCYIDLSNAKVVAEGEYDPNASATFISAVNPETGEEVECKTYTVDLSDCDLIEASFDTGAIKYSVVDGMDADSAETVHITLNGGESADVGTITYSADIDTDSAVAVYHFNGDTSELVPADVGSIHVTYDYTAE